MILVTIIVTKPNYEWGVFEDLLRITSGTTASGGWSDAPKVTFVLSCTSSFLKAVAGQTHIQNMRSVSYFVFETGGGAYWMRSLKFASAVLHRILVVTVCDKDYRGAIRDVSQY